MPYQIKAHIILNGNTHGPELDPNVFSHRRFPLVCGDQLQAYLKMYLAPNGSQDPSGPLCPGSACIPGFLAAHLGALFEWSDLKAVAHERASRLLHLESEIARTSATLEALLKASHPADIGLSNPANALIYPFSLTPRERKIAELIAEGCSARDIAAKLGISCITVKTYRNRIRTRLGIKSQPVNFQTYLKYILK